MAEWWLGPTTSDQCGQNPAVEWTMLCVVSYVERDFSVIVVCC